jgi:hypothetical protein
VKDILNEVFDADLDEGSRDSGVRCLIILQSLLRLESVRAEDSSKVLKWVYELACVNAMELSMELCNVLTSIKKRLIRLGFSVLEGIAKEEKSAETQKSTEEETVHGDDE